MAEKQASPRLAELSHEPFPKPQQDHSKVRFTYRPKNGPGTQVKEISHERMKNDDRIPSNESVRGHDGSASGDPAIAGRSMEQMNRNVAPAMLTRYLHGSGDPFSAPAYHHKESLRARDSNHHSQ
jgi:hypothetical protein